MTELPRCAMCRLTIQVGQTVQFRVDGRMVHVDCPEVLCPVCADVILPNTPIRRDGGAILHSNCWMRRHRGTLTPRPMEDHIRAEILAGRLPSLDATRVSAAPGHGAPCQACQQVIPSGEPGYEIVFANTVTVRMHRDCYLAWQAVAGNGTVRPIQGGSGTLPWTVVTGFRIDDGIEGIHELMAAAAEAIAHARTTRVATAVTRAESLRRCEHAKRLARDFALFRAAD